MAQSPRLVYEALIAEINDEDERKVFDCFLNAGAERVTRDELVKAVYGPSALDTEDGVSYSTMDRKIREIIGRLRERDYPIVSSSDAPGYTMQATEAEMDLFIAQQRSRIERLQAKIDHAYRSRRISHLVNEYRAAQPKPAIQLSFIEEVV